MEMTDTASRAQVGRTEKRFCVSHLVIHGYLFMGNVDFRTFIIKLSNIYKGRKK